MQTTLFSRTKSARSAQNRVYSLVRLMLKGIRMKKPDERLLSTNPWSDAGFRQLIAQIPRFGQT